MHLQPVYEHYKYFGKKLIAERIFDFGLCLPSGSNLTDDEWQRIEDGLSGFAGKINLG